MEAGHTQPDFPHLSTLRRRPCRQTAQPRLLPTVASWLISPHSVHTLTGTFFREQAAMQQPSRRSTEARDPQNRPVIPQTEGPKLVGCFPIVHPTRYYTFCLNSFSSIVWQSYSFMQQLAHSNTCTCFNTRRSPKSHHSLPRMGRTLVCVTALPHLCPPSPLALLQQRGGPCRYVFPPTRALEGWEQDPHSTQHLPGPSWGFRMRTCLNVSPQGSWPDRREWRRWWRGQG